MKCDACGFKSEEEKITIDMCYVLTESHITYGCQNCGHILHVFKGAQEIFEELKK